MPFVSENQKAQVISLLQEGKLGREEIAAKVGVSPGTVSAVKAHITMGTYGGSPASEAETDELIQATEATFGLERDLQVALRSNIQQLEDGLVIIDNGKEYATDAGRVDILARDRGDAIVVIELKAGTAAPEALTQLLAYMGTVRKQEGQAVRGILVAGDFHPRVIFAARAVPNVKLCRYRFKFTFEAVE